MATSQARNGVHAPPSDNEMIPGLGDTPRHSWATDNDHGGSLCLSPYHARSVDGDDAEDAHVTNQAAEEARTEVSLRSLAVSFRTIPLETQCGSTCSLHRSSRASLQRFKQ